MVNWYLVDWVIMAVVVIFSAIMALEAKEIVVAIFFFDVFALGIGGLFLLFNAGFVALFQLAVYAGAVSVIVLFAVMLTRRTQTTGEEQISRATMKTRIASILLVVTIAAIMIILVTRFAWNGATLANYPMSSGDHFNIYLFFIDHYELVFFGIGLLLATSLIGGVALLRGRGKKEEVEVAS